MHQPVFILPGSINHEWGRVEQDFVKAIEPGSAQFHHRQRKKQRDTGLHQFSQLNALQRNQPFLLQQLAGDLNQTQFLIFVEAR
ncbi:hypothetical protein SRABI106_03783 [Rahnella aquatilis]|nr:hypothetical protein SRABI106_03783 [Rahnella aquatilis]